MCSTGRLCIRSGVSTTYPFAVLPAPTGLPAEPQPSAGGGHASAKYFLRVSLDDLPDFTTAAPT